ncbi:MAG: tetratricopeptide repeat protein, partial [Rhodanobacteraceae bacterium]
MLQDSQKAARLYEQAISLDPKFALAHARLSAAASIIYHWFEPTAVQKEKARSEAKEALRLQPNLGEAHLALGLYYYYIDSDYNRALAEFDLAGRALPNDGDVGLYIAAVRRRQGRLKESMEAYKKAEAMDPRNPVTLYDAAQTYFLLRDWKATIQGLDRVLALSPDSPTVIIERAYAEFFRTGSTRPIKETLAKIPADIDPDGTVTFARWDVALLDRDPQTASEVLDSCPFETITTADGTPVPKTYLQGCAALVAGDNARAQTYFEQARPVLEKTVSKSPDDAARHAHLGLLYAFMGRKDEALREGQRARELKPIAHDFVDGAQIEVFQALIYS